MNFKLSHLIAVGITSVTLLSSAHAQINQPAEIKLVDKNIDVIFRVDIAGNEDVFSPTDKTNSTYVRILHRNKGSISMEIPSMCIKLNKGTENPALAKAKIYLNDDGVWMYNGRINSQSVDLRLENLNVNGQKMSQFNKDDFSSALQLESSEIQHSIENNDQIKSFAKQFNSSLMVDEVSNSALSSTSPTEMISPPDANGNMVIHHTARTVTVKAHYVAKVPEGMVLPIAPGCQTVKPLNN
jgi:hypothetical protein